MREVACQFGEKDRLFGVLTLPQRRRPGPVLVLLSAGLTAKSGPYRLYTEIARELAASGVMVLRFDLGGIGNSQVARPDLPLQSRTEQDIRDALRYMEENHDAGVFVVGGLCSGAEDAFRYAEKDARVRGVVLVDPHAYDTAWWRLRGIVSRYSLNRVVYRFLRSIRAINVIEDSRNGSNIEGFEGSLINYQYMDRTESTKILSALVQRHAGVHYIYTGGSIDTFHHRRQFLAMFPGMKPDSRLVVDFLPHVEHVQIFAEDRKALVDTVVRRFSEMY